MTTVALYTRVSTDEQVNDGYSLAAQLDRLRSYCDSQGWDIAGVYTDEGVSAKNMDRPRLQELLRDCTQGKFEVVLVYRLDRITRSVLNLHELLNTFNRFNIGFKSATEEFSTLTAQGRFFITLVGAMAQWERENLGERIRMGLDQKKREGRWHSTNAPYGYRYIAGELVQDKSEAELVRMMFDQYIEGMGVHRLMQWLREHSDVAWTHSRTYYALNNPIYAGLMVIGDRNAAHDYETIEAINVNPIISLETWMSARNVAKRRAGLPPRSGTGMYALVGVLRCGICGSAVVGYTTSKKTGYKYFGYKCLKATHKQECDNKMHKCATLEATVLEELETAANETLENAHIRPPSASEATKIARLETLLVKAMERRKRWMDAYETGVIDADALRERMERIAQEVAETTTSLRSLSAPTVNIEVFRYLSTNFRSAWEAAQIIERRELIRAVAQRIYVYPDGTVKIELVQ